jgi:hypothetical protein
MTGTRASIHGVPGSDGVTSRSGRSILREGRQDVSAIHIVVEPDSSHESDYDYYFDNDLFFHGQMIPERRLILKRKRYSPK